MWITYLLTDKNITRKKEFARETEPSGNIKSHTVYTWEFFEAVVTRNPKTEKNVLRSTIIARPESWRVISFHSVNLHVISRLRLSDNLFGERELFLACWKLGNYTISIVEAAKSLHNDLLISRHIVDGTNWRSAFANWLLVGQQVWEFVKNFPDPKRYDGW